MKRKIGSKFSLLPWSILILTLCSDFKSTLSTKLTPRKGFLLTSPKVLIAGSTETLCLSLYGITSNGSANVTLKTIDEQKDIAEIVQTITDGNETCFKMAIPPKTFKSVSLNIEGRFEDNYIISGKTTVSIEPNSTMTFIQTDKPIYKPKQTVQFRILRLDVELKPIKEQVETVWIEDPTGIRVAMWKNLTSDQGLIDLSLKLSDEPPLGDWTIMVQQSTTKEFKKFTVKEYVLPKFSVEITSPSCIVTTEETSLWKVCAKYSYGQPVVGTLTVIVPVKDIYRIFDSKKLLHAFNLTTEINGCKDIEINRTDLRGLNIPNYYSQKVDFFAEVVEKGTEIKINATKTVEVRPHPYKITLKHKSHFKPGLSFSGTVLVSLLNGQPAPNTTVAVFIDTSRSQGVRAYSGSNDYQSDENGEIQFTIAPQGMDIERIMLKAVVKIDSIETPGLQGATELSSVNSWHSPSNSFLQLELKAEHNPPLSCNTKQPIIVSGIFPMDMLGQDIALNYQILSRGEMFFQDRLQVRVNSEVDDTDEVGVETNEMNKTTKVDETYGLDRTSLNEANETSETQTKPHFKMENLQISLDIKPRMSPESHLFMFYIRPDGEVVSDYMKIKIQNCFDNKVEMSFGDQEILPGTPTKIKLGAQPESLCALSAVDESVYMLSGNNHLNAETVFSKLTSSSHSKKFKSYKDDSNEVSCVKKPGDFLEPEHRYARYIHTESHLMDTMESLRKAGIAVISDLMLITRPCKVFRPYWYRGLYSARTGVMRSSHTMDLQMSVTHPFGSANRAFHTESTHPLKRTHVQVNEQKQISVAKPALEIRDFFPETWLWDLHNIGKEGMVMFDRMIPHSITTWTASTFCTSSTYGLGISNPTSIRSFQPFFLSYTMPYSVKNGEQVPLKVSIFNYLSKCFTVNLRIEKNAGFEISGSQVEKACVCGYQSHTHTFMLRAKKMGHLNVTVHAHSIGQQNITSLCENGTQESDVIAHDAITKPLFVQAHGLPKEIVNATMFCSNDKDEIYSNIYTLVLPHNVIEGSARAYVKIVGDVMGPSITGLEKLVRLPTGCGEQNMILFVPNIFVLQYLTNTNQLTEDIKDKTKSHLTTGYQRELTYKHNDGGYSAFGNSDTEGSMWLTAFVLKSFAQAQPFTFIDEAELDSAKSFIKKYQMENGCFESKGRIWHKELKGGLEGQQSSSMKALTAYVIVALLEAGMPPSSDMIKNAFLCLEADSQPDLYLLALKTYASALIGPDDRTWKNWQELEAKSSGKTGIMYWEVADSSKAVNIEITSYALMALAAINSPEHNVKALSIVRWLTQQRNADGGFVSTQDTVLALQALSKFASIIANRSQEVNIEVRIETDDLDDTIYVNEENRLVMQTRKLSQFPTVLDVEATGSGCALLEVTLKYNIEEETTQEAFALDVDVDCDKEKIHICTRYLNSDEKSNMAVVEVNMLSGYEAFKTKLNELQNDVRTPVKRAEINDEGTVNLYFDELTLKRLCVDVDVHRAIAVKDIKPAFITVYDYYQPELSTSKYYSFDSPLTCTKSVQRQSEHINCTEANGKVCPKVMRRPAKNLSNVQMTRQGNSKRSTVEKFNPSPLIIVPRTDDSLILRTPDCPVCFSKNPPNFQETLCNGDIAIIAEVRNTTTRRMKLRSNIHSSLDRFQRINAMTQYEIGSSCDCGLLVAGQQILIIGKLPKGTTRIPEPIKLNRDFHLIRLQNSERHSLQRLHKQCQN